MNSRQFMDNPDYVEYVRLLRRLHEMKVDGVDQTDESDEVRDEMDGPWYRMSREEIHRSDGLSADLYTISDPDRQPPPRLAPEAWSAQGRDAESRGDWEALLALIREDPGPMSPADLAFARARWWFQLGDPESALLFVDEAARLRPSEWNIARFRSHLLEKLGREHEAIEVLAEFAEVHPDQVPDPHRDTFLKAIEDRKLARRAMEESTGRLRDYGRALVAETSIPAA